MPFAEEELLELAHRNAQEAEVYAVQAEETTVTFEANRLKGVHSRQTRSVALRIIKDGRIGFAAATGPEDPRELLDVAMETAAFGAEARFRMPGSASYGDVPTYDPAVAALPVDALVELGQRAIDAVRPHAPEIQCEARVSRRVESVRIMNTAGVDARVRKSVLSAYLHGTVVRDTDMLFVGERVAWCRAELEPSALSGETVQQLELARETVPGPRGRVPVVFTPRGVAQLLGLPLSLALNGRTVLQGGSPLAGRLGESCMDRRISLWDDPGMAYSAGSRPFDDEGTPARRIALVENGVLRSFLYDLQTGAQAGVGSTGSASRAMGGLPSPAIAVLVVGAGETSFEEILADIEDGLVVEEMLGSSQGNTLGGDFGGNVVLGYRVQRGRITGRVKDTMVAGNVYDLLRRPLALGRERRWVGGTMLLPPMAFDGVTVSSR